MRSYTIANASTGIILGTYSVPASLHEIEDAIRACCVDAGYDGEALDTEVERMRMDDNITVSPDSE